MRDTIFYIIFLGIFVYLGFATLFGGSGLMGSFGMEFAKLNKFEFGYIAYINIFLLLIPLTFFYKDKKFDFRTLELSMASLLVFFSALLAQSILVSNDAFKGKIATNFVDFLEPYIGIFGLWVFWVIISSISILIFIDKDIKEIIAQLKMKKDFLQKREQPQEPLEVLQQERIEQPSSEPLSMQEVQKQGIEEELFNDEQEVVIKVIKKETPAYEEPQEEQNEQVERVEETPFEVQEEIEEENTQEVEIQVVEEEKEQEIEPKQEEDKKSTNAVIVNELEENSKLLAELERGTIEKPKDFNLPSLDFLQKPSTKSTGVDENELDDKIRYLIEKLKHFKIDGDVVRTYAGPVVSTFEFKPAANVKVSKILNLQDDLAMALSAETIRIQAPIPGKNVVGIEIPNDTVDTIYLREILESKLFQEASSPLTIALGKDIVGKPFVTDLKKLPHLLIAGTTGSGKSVGINAMILSMLYKNSPDQLRLLMIDPKMLEFSIYNDIPHLLTPVITKPKQAIIALNNMVAEMERRYELMADSRTKNIENYNEKVKKEGGEFFPYIVVIIDELADLMMTSGKDVEISIARLAQKSRACGIHLIVATQRPSVDVVTGLIKANLPSRVSYRVGQKVDSKIILDQVGAESLLGRGDMLFTPPGAVGLVRLHAPWATEQEIEEIVEFIKSQREANYDKSFLLEESESDGGGSRETYEELDPLFEEAKQVVLTDRKTSISYLQRKLQIGYNRSARVVEQLEAEGVLSAPNAKGTREILL